MLLKLANVWYSAAERMDRLITTVRRTTFHPSGLWWGAGSLPFDLYLSIKKAIMAMTTTAAPVPKRRYQLNKKSHVAVVGGTVDANAESIRNCAGNRQQCGYKL